jgi:hypothetical protein
MSAVWTVLFNNLPISSEFFNKEVKIKRNILLQIFYRKLPIENVESWCESMNLLSSFTFYKNSMKI